MRSILWLLAPGFIAATLSLPVYCAEQSTGNASTAAASENMMGEHNMTGTISSIDHKTGVVKLNSKPHDMELHFPPDSVKDLNKGDKITVHLSFRKD